MPTGLDCKTYKGGTGAGGRINLARPSSVLSLSAQGTSIFWVKPNPVGTSVGGNPGSTPDPSANTVAEGWLRVAAAESPPNGGANNIPLPDGQKIVSLDVWCEAAGYLIVLASEGLPAVARSV